MDEEDNKAQHGDPAPPQGTDPGPANDELALYRVELDRLRQATLQLRTAFHEKERDLERTRRRLREVSQSERALREHPAVRALLAAGRLSRPLRSRVGRAGVTTPAGDANGAGRPPGRGGRAAAPARHPHLSGGREGVGWRPAPEMVVDAPGPADYRRRLRDRARGDGDRPLRVVLAGGRTAALRDSLVGFGWHVTPLGALEAAEACPPDADAVIVASPVVDGHALPAHPVRIGLVTERLDGWLAAPWFDDLDVVLADGGPTASEVAARSAKAPRVVGGSDLAEAVREALLDWCDATRVSLAVATPTRDVAEWWGDTHFGRALQRQLERQGHPTRLYLREAFPSPDLVRSDVAVHLLGLVTPRPQAGQVNVLWAISHPERVDRRRTEGYDLVLTASDSFAARLTPMVDPPVVALYQATDPERFRPDPTGPAHDLLFVGNSRRTRRTIIDDLTPTRHDLAVYGGDWTPDLLDPRHLHGQVVPNAELHRYYSSAKIVLNDHWPQMARLGFVSNRIFDALAAGAMVVTDQVDGLDRLFDGAVVSYHGRDELRALVDRYLADAGARRELAERGRAAVLAHHTFAHRARRIMELVQPFLDARRTP